MKEVTNQIWEIKKLLFLGFMEEYGEQKADEESIHVMSLEYL